MRKLSRRCPEDICQIPLTRHVTIDEWKNALAKTRLRLEEDERQHIDLLSRLRATASRDT